MEGSGASGSTVVRLSLDRAELDEVARVSAAAFHDDPFFGFLMPSDSLRWRGLTIFFRSIVATARPVAVVYGARSAEGRLLGVAAFIRPGGFPLTFLAQVRQLLDAGRALAPRPRALFDGARYQIAVERAHPRTRQWYLQLLAVDPTVQRGGIGGALQRQVYPSADEEGLDCYLETQKEDNLAYYRRFGYEVENELRPVRRGPPLWTLSRPPRPPDH